MSTTYEVQVEENEEGPPPELVERFAVVAAHRLARLNEQDGHHPEVGGTFDMLDHFEGPYFWERSDADLEADPPSSVTFEVLAVDPVDAPADGGSVQVRVAVVF